jgi:hypothetical protein
MEARLCDICKKVIPPNRRGLCPEMRITLGGIEYLLTGSPIIDNARSYDLCETCFEARLADALIAMMEQHKQKLCADKEKLQKDVQALEVERNRLIVESIDLLRKSRPKP